MKTEPTITGIDMGRSPGRTVIIVRDADGRYRHATEKEILRLRKQQAYGAMKERFSDEG